LLLPGMTANVDIVLGSKTGVLKAPNAALRFRPPGAEESTATGFGGGDADSSAATARIEQIGVDIGLEGDKLKQYVAIVERNQEELREAVAAARTTTTGGTGTGTGRPTFDRTALTNIQAKLTSELRLILTEEQFAAYQEAAGGGAGGGTGTGRTGRDRGAATTENTLTGTGEIWVMRDGEPTLVAVRTGLADLEFTEIQSDELAVGDEVIVRAVVLNND